MQNEKDTLYLLKPDFRDKDKVYFCPGCAEVAGYLQFYPAVKERLNIRYVDFPRPRPELAPLLGEENQSCPVLVLASGNKDDPAGVNVQTGNGHAFVEGAKNITTYLAQVHRTGIPH